MTGSSPPSDGPRHLVLIGMMGGGKTTVGVLVADRLGRSFLDLDQVVEDAAGASIPEQFARVGEEGFRRREADALAVSLDGREPIVLATGGGVVLAPSNRAALRAGSQVVWLRARPETLAARVGSGAGRPLLTDATDDPVAVLRRLDAERAPLYAEVADLVIDVDELTPIQVVDRIVAALP